VAHSQRAVTHTQTASKALSSNFVYSCRAWLLEELLCNSHSPARSAGVAPADASQAGQVLAAAVQQLDAQPAQELLDGLLVR
jgi:hypothetical protein